MQTEAQKRAALKKRKAACKKYQTKYFQSEKGKIAKRRAQSRYIKSKKGKAYLLKTKKKHQRKAGK
jgi:hypothetical protein